MRSFASCLAGLLAAALLLSGCVTRTPSATPTAAAAAAPTSGDYTTKRNLQYGPGERGTFDLYVPAGAGPRTPVAVFIHGGSWSSGSKAYYAFVGRSLASAGIIAALPSYRLYPEVVFPGFVEDGAKATASIARQTRAGLDGVPAGNHPVFLIGHSAGAEIAALLALDTRYLAAEGYSAANLAGFVGLSGPYDFLPITWKRYARIFPTERLADSQPVNFARRGAPPTLLIAGLSDGVVNPENTRSLERRLRAAGASVEAEYYPGVSHTGTVTAFAKLLSFGDSAIRDRVIDFIRRRS